MVANGSKQFLMKAGLYYRLREWKMRDGSRCHQKAFYAHFLKSDDLVFDVGANIGDRSEIFSGLCHKVVAVEPTAECIRHLQSRFRWNRKVSIEPIALSDSEGEEVIYESDNYYLSSLSSKFIQATRTGRFNEHQWREGVTVRTSTLDRLLLQYGVPAFIKIDVEGYELKVLQGLNQAVKHICFEFTPEFSGDMNRCVERLASLSNRYVYNYYYEETFRFRLEDWVTAQTFLTQIAPEIAHQNMTGEVYARLS